ncbi:MAG: HemK2/MTQ2 family protein methyltransferase [Candidatus Njordarchaeia archaeon]
MQIKINKTTIEIKLCKNVYPPDEDTFLLLDEIKNLDLKNKKVLEIGTGTGIIAITCAKKGAKVTATDIKLEAIKCTQKNAKLNNVKIETKQGNLFQPVKGEKYDLIIFNPPYLPENPETDKYLNEKDKQDLIGGKHGNETAIQFIKQLKNHLKPNGQALLIQTSLTNIQETLKQAEKTGLKTQITKQKNLPREILHLIKIKL